jgi:hypothetical protein
LFVPKIKSLSNSENIEDKILKKYLITISNFKNVDTKHQDKLFYEDFENLKYIKENIKNKIIEENLEI